MRVVLGGFLQPLEEWGSAPGCLGRVARHATGFIGILEQVG
jgi:hypothetical protein